MDETVLTTDSWTRNHAVGTSGTSFSQCGNTQVYGGYQTLSNLVLKNIQLSRTATVAHSYIQVRFRAIFIDRWATGGYLKVYVNSVLVYTLNY